MHVNYIQILLWNFVVITTVKLISLPCAFDMYRFIWANNQQELLVSLHCVLTHFSSERRRQMVSIPAQYSGGSGFKSQPADRQYWLEFPDLSQSLGGKCWVNALNCNKTVFFISFPIHWLSYYSTLYTLKYGKRR